MQITKEQLQQIIKEELESLVREKEESPKILHDKEIGYYYINGREIVFTDKDGAERENVPRLVRQRARVKRAQGDLK